MNYKLLKDINPNYTAIEQILTNRGIPLNEITHYLHTTDADINEPEELGEENLKAAAACLTGIIAQDKNALIIGIRSYIFVYIHIPNIIVIII